MKDAPTTTPNEFTIKRESSAEANISERNVHFDVYQNGKYHSSYVDVLAAIDATETAEDKMNEAVSADNETPCDEMELAAAGLFADAILAAIEEMPADALGAGYSDAAQRGLLLEALRQIRISSGEAPVPAPATRGPAGDLEAIDPFTISIAGAIDEFFSAFDMVSGRARRILREALRLASDSIMEMA